MDLEIKLTDNHLQEIKNITKSKTNTIQSIFMRKSTQAHIEEKSTDIDIEVAI
jgi:hypothetical protein